MDRFELVTDMVPRGDQPQAIEQLLRGVQEQLPAQVLLGVTGSGKTFTIAHVVARINRPTLVISHNKTLAAQLYSEFKELFPHNAVEYFVSYYDYYQPEAYIPQTDTYIEKDSSINDELDRLRLSATSSLLSRRDVIIVASVSCIYNLGSPSDYSEMLVFLEQGQRIAREEMLKRLVAIQYERNDIEFQRGRFRVRGDVVEIFPAYRQTAFRVELFGDEIEQLSEIHPLTGEVIGRSSRLAIYPAKHFVTTTEHVARAQATIAQELEECVEELKRQEKLLEAQRLLTRTRYDMEMLREIGYCHGVENYARHLSGRPPGSRPYCLLDYFPEDFLTVIDESHVTMPQLRGMYNGDRARKETLVNYGFRLPSCLDNRPLRFEELGVLIRQTIYVSATPNAYELERAGGVAVEQIIRPTGLLDPEVTLKPTQGQVDDLIGEIRTCAKRHERVLVTTLTKRMAEDLAAYLQEVEIKVKYLHSEIDTIERVQILRDLRLQKFDCVVGVNLLREGLDLPEVSLVAVLDADKEGFLRSQTSLIQVAGRAARNINGRVILYADTVTGSMRRMMDETTRRRRIQQAYNRAHGITPTGVAKAVRDGIEALRQAEELVVAATGQQVERHEIEAVIAEMEHEMQVAARNLQFERAAMVRDQIKRLREQVLSLGQRAS